MMTLTEDQIRTLISSKAEDRVPEHFARANRTLTYYPTKKVAVALLV